MSAGKAVGKENSHALLWKEKHDGAAVDLSAAAAPLFDPTVRLPGVYQKGPTACCKDTCSFVAAAVALLTVSGTWQQPTCLSNNEGVMTCDACIKMEFSLARKEKEMMKFCR